MGSSVYAYSFWTGYRGHLLTLEAIRPVKTPSPLAHAENLMNKPRYTRNIFSGRTIYNSGE